MLLHRSGTGGPPVVFLADDGMFGLYYWNVHDLLAEFTTSVLYDRLGTGWSDVVDLPRSGTQVTGDLHELLRTAAVPGGSGVQPRALPAVPAGADEPAAAVRRGPRRRA
ncbi:hypothetical protein [Amycolatopsis sp. NPDC051372]|uniref:alpha/beta fold hydrolase n=1 Tax=Amycolatopsis sp. NPDC051372 TaxID=3155669 RepID=UPI00342DE6A1